MGELVSERRRETEKEREREGGVKQCTKIVSYNGYELSLYCFVFYHYKYIRSRKSSNSRDPCDNNDCKKSNHNIYANDKVNILLKRSNV